MADLVGLAARVEAATGADREIDALIHAFVELGEFGRPAEDAALCLDLVRANPDFEEIARYTASLDAAMTLADGYDVDFQRRKHRSYAAVSFTPINGFEQRGEGWAATPALALTAACLKARATTEGGSHG